MKQSTVVSLPYLLFGAWSLAALTAVVGGLFGTGTGEPSLAIVAQLAVVVAGFLLLYRTVPALRRGVKSLDPALLTSLQSWRILGTLFLFLMALGRLPAVFAIPAGVGDVLIGLAAPFVADRLRRGTLSRRAFGSFTALGLLDFAVALCAGNYVNLHPEVYTGYASMAALPLVIVPALFVPAFSILHLAAWLAPHRQPSGGALKAAARA